ncbi:Galactose oxidase, central domain containing protein, putative [Trypanosoma equiperdum]|uniref:Uncharacterized protein n=2 Tax=Trypanozoon TaxID=39700 RepID=Q383D3_TRYB2|nr:hypothetical protein, conserved [Trypanosoma brucei brucei TREU927]EAN80098.1 hypothetical protein, conserved [Trypanosoma brucei brucei TREU927]SCU71637.1 Galactose oxidase, central domain containing protein, putative [Trypanosoma equiperdum]
MQAWYQFGYDGFPSGDARRRFYCQRDDPCDSEEEQEGYDGNDRPIYYYPMRDSEEASIASAPIAEEEEDALLQQLPTSPFPINISVCNEILGRCGADVVPLRTICGDTSAGEEVYFFVHGGALTATGRVTNASEVVRIKGCTGGKESGEAVTSVATDASLAEVIFSVCGGNPIFHELYMGTSSSSSPPARFGHCTVGIQAPPWVEALSSRCRSDCELYLSLVIGGAFVDQVPKSFHDVIARDSVLCEPWLCATVLKGNLGSPGADGIREKRQRPLTEVCEEPKQYTLHAPLPGMTGLTSTPRLFATLTPWPVAHRDPIITSYAYMGGSLNGWDPLPLFGLWLLHVDTFNWSVSVSLLETLGEEPPSRFGHSATLVNEKEIYVFGGIGTRRTYLNDLMVLNCTTKVWREVYAPSCFSIPPRAFHSSALLPGNCTVVIVGGEAEGRHESSVWRYDVTRGDWRLLSFPLLERALRPPRGACGASQTGCTVSATRLLCERERLTSEGKNSLDDARQIRVDHSDMSSSNRPSSGEMPRSTTSGVHVTSRTFCSSGPSMGGDTPNSPLGVYYFAAMHGSQPQVFTVKDGTLVLGGTKSPGVASLSWIPARTYSLKECAALWICTHREGFLEEAGCRLRSPCDEVSQSEACHYGKSPVEGCCASLVDRSLAEDQLDKWQRSARKRLRGQ